jgi:hypothetical protein
MNLEWTAALGRLRRSGTSGKEALAWIATIEIRLDTVSP